MHGFLRGAAIAATVLGLSSPTTAEQLYPQGTKFPVALLAIGTESDVAAVKSDGWNLFHTYSAAAYPAYLDMAVRQKVLAQAPLPCNITRKSLGHDSGYTKAVLAPIITTWATRASVGWWTLPEEQRYWVRDEMAIVKNYSRWVRTYDPLQRPCIMYIPGNYNQASIENYVPYLDILGASAYVDYYKMPRPWIRHKLASTIAAVTARGYKLGSDYLHGQKTVAAYLQLYHAPGTAVPTPAGCYHDFWSSVASGARGIIIYSYAYRETRSGTDLSKCWTRYRTAAAQLTSSTHNIGSAWISGSERPVFATVAAGPANCPSFHPYGGTGMVTLPSIQVSSRNYNGKTYLIAINSNSHSVTAAISGLPKTVRTATLPFENRTVGVSSGRIVDVFEPLAVHIYKM